MKAPSFKAVKTVHPQTGVTYWRISIPATLSANGKRQQRHFRKKGEADLFAQTLRVQLEKHGRSAMTLAPEKASVAARVFDLLDGREPEELIAIVKAHLKREEAANKSVTFEEAVAAFLKARPNLSKQHLKSYERLPARLPTLAKRLVCEITIEDVERSISRFSDSVRNAILTLAHSVFAFSADHGWLPENQNPAHKRLRVQITKHDDEVSTISASQLRRLLDTAADVDIELVPVLAIRVFAGVRAAESTRLDWSDIDLHHNFLTVRARNAKTKRVRHVEIHPTLRQWLLWYGPRTGRVSPAEFNETLHGRLRRVYKAAGLWPWPENCLRHTFGSASIASGWRTLDGAMKDMGHRGSPRIFHDHYFRSMLPDDGRAIFSVEPQRVYNVVPMTA